MKTLKKIIEKPIKKEELERLKLLHRGFLTIDQKARKAALEKDVEFMEKEGKYLSPDEFHSLLFSKKVKAGKIPLKYKNELDRYEQMFVSKFADVLDIEEIRGTKLGQTLGVPAAKENLFEIKKKGKRFGFILLDEKGKTVDFIKHLDDIPKKFKKKIKG